MGDCMNDDMETLLKGNYILVCGCACVKSGEKTRKAAEQEDWWYPVPARVPLGDDCPGDHNSWLGQAVDL